MVLYENNEDMREVLKEKYPSGIPGHSNSLCCNEKTVIVKYSEGGFVKRKCKKCSQEETLSDFEFEKLDLQIECPKCKKLMKPGRILYSNYGYRCDECNLDIKLADLLP